MNRFKLFLLPALLLVCFGCAREVPVEQTRIREGKLFVKGEQTPFSGIVVGDIRAERLHYKRSYEEGLLNGRSYYYYKDGTAARLEPYTNGKVNGVMMAWYPTGKVKYRAHLVDGQRGGASGEVFFMGFY